MRTSSKKGNTERRLGSRRPASPARVRGLAHRRRRFSILSSLFISRSCGPRVRKGARQGRGQRGRCDDADRAPRPREKQRADAGRGVNRAFMKLRVHVHCHPSSPAHADVGQARQRAEKTRGEGPGGGDRDDDRRSSGERWRGICCAYMYRPCGPWV
ncbi:hypothetical protein B0H13DRAFT_1941651, partial [Mycena leptocephala]